MVGLGAGGGADTVELEARLTALAVRQRTQRGAIGVLEARLAAAKTAQRVAVVAELRRLADVAQAEHEKVDERAAALLAELKDLGVLTQIHPHSPFVHAKARPERLQRAADAVAAGQSCPIDAATGLGYDRGLW